MKPDSNTSVGRVLEHHCALVFLSIFTEHSPASISNLPSPYLLSSRLLLSLPDQLPSAGFPSPVIFLYESSIIPHVSIITIASREYYRPYGTSHLFLISSLLL